MQPTPEQHDAIELFASGMNLAIEAGAGTGKTTTLVQLARSTSRSGQYVAFNRAIVDDSKRKMPANVSARTAHSLAMGAVGHRFRHRIGGGRVRSDQIARQLGIGPLVVSYGSQRKVLQPGFLASHAMRAIRNFCFTADPEPTALHIAYIDGIDAPESDGRRGWKNNDVVRDTLAPMLPRIWSDLCSPDGTLPYTHDCQPPGTLVRRVVRRGGHFGSSWEDVPIESIRVGDRVVTMTIGRRRGFVRRDGRPVSAAGPSHFDGTLVTVTTERGRVSSYTPEHKAIARLDSDLSEGNVVVYLARRGEHFRVGRTTWRTRSQGNSNGLRRRLESQRADDAWVLSVHENDREAALAEALVSYRFHLPTWQFVSVNETMPLSAFWSAVGPNQAQAAACLAAHGRDLRYPLIERQGGWYGTSRRPVFIRACNLLSGMLVCEPDEIVPDVRGAMHAHDGSKGWSPATVRHSVYSGPVYSLDVDEDHSYVADGIATGNCYLKLWERSEPKMGVDFVLFDEAQDAAPVMLSIIDQQEHAQRVYVGDSCQQIYEWRGAVNALQTVDTDARTFLTQSFRFGQAVADLANLVLDELGAELRLRGFDSIPSRVDALSKPDAILTRTNAAAIHEVLTLQAGGVAAHLVGGADDVASFARAAQQLMDGKPTYHPELACFTSWPEVKEYCLDPSTRVLCTDLIWREIDTIAVGDELLGFDEHAGVGTSGRKYQRALVESTQRIVRPCWRVWFDDGTEVVASTEHRWLVGYGSANLKWQTTDRLRIGTRMATVGRPWTRDETHDGGWIAGIFDGEGWLTKRTSADAQRGSASIGVSQKPGPVLDRMMLLLKEREFEFARRDYTSASTLTITGGVAERLRLMGTLRPTRLLDGFVDTLIGRRVEARRTTCVVGVEYVGEREVVALGTSTSTFIAEGLHSHNCVIDPSGDELRLLVDLIEEFTVPTILRALDNVCPENQAQCVVSTAHKSKGREWRSVRLAGDFDRPDGETALSAGEWRLLYVALTRAREVLDMRACAPLVSLVAEHEMVDVVDVPADL